MLHRFPFTSALKRMAVVLQSEGAPGEAASTWVVVKGAPEVIEQHLASKPADYDAGYKRFAAEGARCAAAFLLRAGLSVVPLHGRAQPSSQA